MLAQPYYLKEHALDYGGGHSQYLKIYVHITHTLERRLFHFMAQNGKIYDSVKIKYNFIPLRHSSTLGWKLEIGIYDFKIP